MTLKSLERTGHLNDNVPDKGKRQGMKNSNSFK